jgi:hypothetical protein
VDVAVGVGVGVGVDVGVAVGVDVGVAVELAVGLGVFVAVAVGVAVAPPPAVPPQPARTSRTATATMVVGRIAVTRRRRSKNVGPKQRLLVATGLARGIIHHREDVLVEIAYEVSFGSARSYSPLSSECRIASNSTVGPFEAVSLRLKRMNR